MKILQCQTQQLSSDTNVEGEESRDNDERSDCPCTMGNEFADCSL